MSSGITVIIPTVRPRRAMLAEALASVGQQTLFPDTIIVQDDVDREGAAVTRQRAQERVQTEWTAPIDDDDRIYPNHLEILLTEAERTNADLVFPWFDCTGSDPFPQFFGLPWNNAEPHVFPVTFLARTEAIRAARGWQSPEGSHEGWGGEDWNLALSLIEIGARIVHLPVRTWLWNHHSSNSSGRPENIRWTP